MTLQYLLIEKIIFEEKSIHRKFIHEINHLGDNIFIVKIENLLEDFHYDGDCIAFKAIKL